MFSNFCPEVTYDRFRYFATYLGRYGDEIDIGAAHEQLGKERAPAGDPRWAWASTQSQHYTECPIYAVLNHRAKTKGNTTPEDSPPWWREHFAKLVIGVIIAAATIWLGKMLA